MRHRPGLITTWSVLLSLAATPLPAQDNPGTIALPDGSRFEAGLPPGGVVFDDASSPIWAEGRNYKASFDRDAFTFVPWFGSDAPQNYPLAISLAHAWLGATSAPESVAPPRRQGNTVIVDRGVLVERYDLTPEHVEQKFVVMAPFAGDLTLTLRVQTALTAGHDAAGLRFGNGLGHVGYTEAVLVDALGRRSPMQTEYADGYITLRASAPQIAGAVFPVTVDPIVRNFAVNTSSEHVLTNSDIAFSPVSSQYMVVWTRVFSATDTDLHAVSIDLSGAVVANSSSLIDNSSDRWDNGRVAAAGGNFLAVASRRAQAGGTRAIWGRTRAVGSPYTMGTAFPISGSEPFDKVNPDVGGEVENAAFFCVVWQWTKSTSDHDINFRRVDSSGGIVGSVASLDQRPMLDARPRIAKTSSRALSIPQFPKHWLVVYQRRIPNTAVHDPYLGAIAVGDGRALVVDQRLDPSPSNDIEPSVTPMTDDGHFLVAFTTNRSGNLDILTYVFTYNPTLRLVSGRFLADAENLPPTHRARDQSRPQVDSDGCRFAVSYLERLSTTDRDAFVTTLHLTPTLAAVEARVELTSSSLDTQSVSLVANRTGEGNEYGIVWDHNATTNPVNSSIQGAIYQGVTPGSGFATRATGCGGLSISFAAGSQVPAPGNTIRFDLSGALEQSIFIVGAPMTAMQLCPPASCALGVAMATVRPGPSLSFTIPCSSRLVGATLAVQGVALASQGGCASLGQLVLSNTVDTTIR